MEKLNIKVSLANRLYPMNVNHSEEKIVRLAASKIEKMAKELKEKYSVRDDQDLLAMCALQLCVKLSKIESSKQGDAKRLVQNIIDIQKSMSEVI